MLSLTCLNSRARVAGAGRQNRRAAAQCRATAQTAQRQAVKQEEPTAVILRAVADAAERAERELCEVAAAAAGAKRRERGQLLDDVYRQLDEEVFFSKGGWVIPPRERALIDAVSAGAATYGEATPDGVDRILDLLCLDDSSTFCDLGSGIGRVVLQAAMSYPVRAAVGLELSDSRLEQAEAAAAVLSGLGVPLRPTRFVRADLGSCDLEAASGGATHYFACSTAFGAALCRSLAERLAAAPSFRALVTSRPLPPQPYLTKLGEVGGVDYSWMAGGSAHVYVRSWGAAPAALLARFWCHDGVCWAPVAPGAGGAAGAGAAPAPPRLAGLVVEEELLAPGPVGAARGPCGGISLGASGGGGEGEAQ